MTTRLTACLVACALGATAAHAGPAADRDPENHYILDCANGCPRKATETAIGSPTGIATDAEGNVYFTSQSIVFKLLRDGTLLRIAGTGARGYSGDGGPAVAARLDIPFDDYLELEEDPISNVPLIGGLALAPDGAVIVADAYNSRLRRVGTDGVISTVADAAGEPFDVFWPQGVALDAAGSLFVGSDYAGIHRLSSAGVVDAIAPFFCGGGPGSGACWPKQFAIDSAGALYFPDGCHVRKWEAGRGISTVAGREKPWYVESTQQCGYWGDGGPASDAGLGWLSFGIAVDAADRVYVADTFNHCIRRIDADGVISTVAGICKLRQWPNGVRPSRPFEGDDGPALRAALASPMGVAVDRDGNVYIADTDHRRVRRVSPDGIITTVAGNGEPLPVMQADAVTPP
jgi:sugar lactone lactonase YvrE